MSALFPKWTNNLPGIALFGALGTLSGAIGVVWYYFTPAFWEVGYMPTQPGYGFSHQIHVGRLGMDCRYCHSHIEHSPEANIPTVKTCYGCHQTGSLNLPPVQNERVEFIREAYAEDQSIEWRRVHKLPEYVRNFPHHVHVNAGVSCYSCHGQIGRQVVVHQVEPLSMAWCLDCHRNPEPHLVPRDQVFNIFAVEQQLLAGNQPSQGGGAAFVTPGGAALLRDLSEKPFHRLPENCGACHY